MIQLLLMAAVMAATPFDMHGVTASGARELVDKVVASVNGQTVTLSAASTPQIANNGKPFPLDQYVTYLLWHQRAQERGIDAPTDEVARNIMQYKEEHGLVGLADDEADRLLVGQIGIDFATYKAQLEQYFMIESLKSHEFRTRCAVAEAEVRAYYDAHPVVVAAEYKIDLMPLSDADKELFSAGKLALENLEWTSLDWLAEHKLADHLKSLKTSEINKPILVSDGQSGWLLTRLVGKKEAYTQTLTERYHAIEVGLQREKMARHAQEAEGEIACDAVIALL